MGFVLQSKDHDLSLLSIINSQKRLIEEPKKWKNQ